MISSFTLAVAGSPVEGLTSAEMMPQIVTRPFDFGEPTKDKYIDSVILQIEHVEDFILGEVHFAYGNRLSDVSPWDTINWKIVRTFTDPSKPIFLRKTARFFSLRLVDRYCRESWKLSTIEWYGEILGTRR